MKTPFFYSALCILLLLQPVVITDAQEINPRLSSFLQLTGKNWEGDLLSPTGEKFTTVVLTFELFGEGDVIKINRQSSRTGVVGEGFFYWNDIESKICFFFIEQSGVFQTGSVVWAGSAFTIEGTMTWPTKKEQGVKQSYDFRNTFELSSGGTLTDKWFMNAFGPWMPGHAITFIQK